MSNEVKPITLKKIKQGPLIINNQLIWKKDGLPFKGSFKVVKQQFSFQEDVLYESEVGDFLFGDFRVLNVKNRLNKITNSCRTVVKCRSVSGEIFEKTSDEITKIIGQSNYNILFSTLCSVINQEMKIRGIVSLLTVPKAVSTAFCQTEQLGDNFRTLKGLQLDMSCQTNESYIALFKKANVRRRAKRSQLAPYVVKEVPEEKVPKRIVISPTSFQKILKDGESQSEEATLPELGAVFDDDSEHSISGLSINTTPELLINPMSMLVDKVTRNIDNIKKEMAEYKLHDLDSPSHVCVNSSPLPQLTPEQKKKAVIQQGLHDWNICLNRDENGHLPIHVAVLNNDVGLLKRHCFALKMRGISVDVTADNLTPLKMTLYQEDVEMTRILLENYADPLETDEHDRNCFHIAAEMQTEHLEVLVNHCQQNARNILEENEELWKPEYKSKSDEELAKILMRYINQLYNNQGYTPLMLAAKVGRYDNVKILVESCPESVNIRMPSSGNTALYLAVGAACMDSTERGNKSMVVDHFWETIHTLVDNGADPNLNNFAGYNVNDLLTEHNNGGLSMLIANKLTCRNFSDGKLPGDAKKCDSFMLIKDKDGKIDIKKIEKQKAYTYASKTTRNPKRTKSTQDIKKPPIVQNVIVKTPPKSLILKSEASTGQSTILPDKISNDSSYLNSPVVQTFKLDKPLILKTVASKNKRKLEITVEPTSKKTNISND